MLPNKLVSLCLRTRIPSCTPIRYLRGGYTVEIKRQKNAKLNEIEEEKRRRIRKMVKSNPGAGHTLYSIQERTGKLDPELDEEFIEDMNVGADDINQTLNEKLELAYAQFDRKSLNNIKRKYFKEDKLPNMVPYCEKQDMKILNESDPEKWDVEKLAECFPVTPEIAKKILKSPFTARSVEQVKNHDKTVQRNWKLFKEGKLDLSPELRNHYEKFVDRVSIETREHVIKKYLPVEPNFELNLKYKEYGKIIDKYLQTKQTKQTEIQIDEDSNKIALESTEIQPKIIPEDEFLTKLRKSVTLAKFRQDIKNNPKKISELSKLIVEMEKKYLPEPKSEVEMVRETDYLAEAEVVDATYQNSLPAIDADYPLRIKIPKDRWKRNKLYQVKDRFYNDSGYFLYRVPGLFN